MTRNPDNSPHEEILGPKLVLVKDSEMKNVHKVFRKQD